MHMHDGMPAYVDLLVGYLAMRTRASNMHSMGVVLLQLVMG